MKDSYIFVKTPFFFTFLSPFLTKMIERIKRNKAYTMLLATLFSLTLLVLLTNITPSSILSQHNSHQDNTVNNTPKLVDDEVPEEEDLVPVSTDPSSIKDWKPKNWGKLSPEIEKAIAYNIRETSKDRILLTAVANQGMADYTLNWIASLKKCGLDDKFLVFAIDETLIDTLTQHGYAKHVVLIPKEWLHTQLSDELEGWLSSGYTPITYSKSLVVERLLYTDVTVWFSDVDIVFTSPHIYDYLLQKLTSRKQTESLFSQETEQKIINSGFYIMRPTLTNKRILDVSIYIQDMEQKKTDKGVKIEKSKQITQQRAMNKVIDELDLNYQTSAIALLDLMLFPHGRAYFDRQIPTKYGLSPMMVHANYRVGDNKKKDLQKFGLWYI